MANDTPKTTTVSAADVAKDLSATAVLSKAEDTTEATAASDEAATASAEAQTAALKAAAATTATVKSPVTKRPASERAVETVQKNLELLRVSAYDSNDHNTAWKRLVEVIERSPKKNILDMIKVFFIKYKNDDFLNVLNALQGTVALEQSINIRVRLLYSIMTDIAAGTATRKSISLEMVRTVFKSDDFVNWVAVNLSRG